MRRYAVCVVIVAAAMTPTGCEKGPPSGAPLGNPSPVSGTVKLADGTPLRGGVIVFTPTEVEVGFKVRYPGEALVDEHGHYTAGLGGSGNGLVPGDYKVSVKGREIGELKNANVSRVPKPLTSPDTTTINVKVEEKENVLDITLK